MDLLVASEIGSLLRFALVVLGIAYLITESAIVSPWRVSLLKGLGRINTGLQLFAANLIYCRACVGFWVGSFVWMFELYPWTAWWSEAGVVGLVLGAFWPNHSPVMGFEAREWDESGDVAAALNNDESAT